MTTTKFRIGDIVRLSDARLKLMPSPKIYPENFEIKEFDKKYSMAVMSNGMRWHLNDLIIITPAISNPCPCGEQEWTDNCFDCIVQLYP